jgi:hypothetical protein
MNIFKYGLFATALAATLTACPPAPTATTVAVTGSNALTNGAAAATYTATFTPSATTGTVEWVLNPPAPNGGTLSASSSSIASGVATVQYTPPVNVAAAIQVTLTANKQGATPAITDTKTITINPTITTGITVSGKVFQWNNKAFDDVNIFITDSTGTNLPDTQSGVDGTFSVPNVVAPYTISAVPAPGTGVSPISYDKVSTATPNLVLTKAGYLTGARPGFNPDPGTGLNENCIPLRQDATMSVELTSIVPVGSTATAIFFGEGISFRPTKSTASANIAGGTKTVTFPVPFDQEFCKNVIDGKLLVIEVDAGGVIQKKGFRDVSVITGNATCVGTCNPGVTGTNTPTLNLNQSAGLSFTGNVEFPQGANDATSNVIAYIRFQKLPTDVPSYFPLKTDSVTRADPNYNTGVIDLTTEGLSYRLQATVVDTAGLATSWANSPIFTTPQAGVVLNYPSFGGTTTPFGNVADGDVTPEFRQGTVSQMNTYFRFFLTAGAQELWLGGSPLTSMTLPVLPDPARLTLQKKYSWFALNALKLADVSATNNGSNVALGNIATGGLPRPYNVLRNLYGSNAVTELDLINSGSFNIKPTVACVITTGQNCP